MKNKQTGLMRVMDAVSPASGEVPAPASRRGKKTDPAYTQICMLVPKEDYYEVRRRLVGADMDASDLVGSLLHEWLKKDPSAKTVAPNGKRAGSRR